MKMVNDVSVMLQGTQITIDREIELIDTLLEDLQKIRTSWPDILSEAKDKARQFNIEDSFPMKRQRKRTRFHDDQDTRDNEENGDPSERFRVFVFFVALDQLISEIDRRMKSSKRLNDLFSFIWSNTSEIDSAKKASILASEYKDDLNVSVRYIISEKQKNINAYTLKYNYAITLKYYFFHNYGCSDIVISTAIAIIAINWFAYFEEFIHYLSHSLFTIAIRE